MNKIQNTCNLTMSYKRTLVRFSDQSGYIVADFTTKVGQGRSLESLCNMAGVLILKVAEYVNENNSPHRSFHYVKLKALAALASRIYPAKSSQQFLEHWFVYHGWKGIKNIQLGLSGTFEKVIDNCRFVVVYRPMVFDTLDKIEIHSGYSKSRTPIASHMFRRAEIVEAGLVPLCEKLVPQSVH